MLQCRFGLDITLLQVHSSEFFACVQAVPEIWAWKA